MQCIDLDFFPEELQAVIDPKRGKKSKYSGARLMHYEADHDNQSKNLVRLWMIMVRLRHC